LDRTTKEAMMAVLSRVNDCPYCGDMLVSLVHGGSKHAAAAQIFSRSEEEIADPALRERLEWVKAVATPGSQLPAHTPFTAEQLPEVIGSLLACPEIVWLRSERSAQRTMNGHRWLRGVIAKASRDRFATVSQ
jgi:AhpD family alkylhydroperoxidase